MLLMQMNSGCRLSCEVLQDLQAFASLNWFAALSYISAASSYLFPKPPNRPKPVNFLSAFFMSSEALAAGSPILTTSARAESNSQSPEASPCNF